MVTLGGDPQRPRLLGHGQPVTALDLHGGGALAPHLRDPPGQQSRAAPRRRPRGWPRRSRRCRPRRTAPGHPGRELGRAVAGEHAVGVRVDEAGQHGPARQVEPVVGGRGLGSSARSSRPGRPRPAAQRRSAGRAGRRRVSSQVTSSPIPVITGAVSWRLQAHAIASRQQRGRRPSRCSPVRTSVLPPTTTRSHIGGRSRRTRSEPAGAGRADRAGIDHRRSRPARPRSAGRRPGQPERCVPGRLAAVISSAGCEPAALPADQPLVHLQAADLLEHVDHRVLVGAEAERAARLRQAPAPGPMPSARSRSVVGQKQPRGAGSPRAG